MIERKRILALDVGNKRTGVAITDPTQSFAQPLKIIPGLDEKKKAASELELILKEYDPECIVVGLPYNQEGGLSIQAQKIREFSDYLQRRFPKLELKYIDESYTSQESERHMIAMDFSRKKRKQKSDLMAAQLILQTYLDALKH
ncbi:MAG: Holliday junction resolvase RuvX [Pseudomonadota bacterium]